MRCMYGTVYDSKMVKVNVVYGDLSDHLKNCSFWHRFIIIFESVVKLREVEGIFYD